MACGGYRSESGQSPTLQKLRADECRDALQAVGDIFRARRVGDADRFVIAKGDTGHDGNFLLVEEPLGELGRVLARGENGDWYN